MIKSTLLILTTACCALAQFRIPLGNSVLLGQARYGLTPLSYARGIYGNPYNTLGTTGLNSFNVLGANPLTATGVAPLTGTGVVAPGVVSSLGGVATPLGGVATPGVVSPLGGVAAPISALGTQYTGYNSLYRGYGGGVNIPTNGFYNGLA